MNLAVAGIVQIGLVEIVRNGDPPVAKQLAQLRAQTQIDAGARHVREQCLLAVKRALQQSHMADFEAVVDDGVLLASQSRCVSKKAIDHVDVARDRRERERERERASDGPNHVELRFWKGSADPAIPIRPACG